MIILTFQIRKFRLKRLNNFIKTSQVVAWVLTQIGLVPHLFALCLTLGCLTQWEVLTVLSKASWVVSLACGEGREG